MDKNQIIELVLYALIAFFLTIALYAFVAMMMARNEFYDDIIVCMGADRSEARYDECYELLKDPIPNVGAESCQ